MDFKKEFSLEQRTKEAQRVLTKYPDRIPIICEKVKKSKLDPMTKKKYLVPWDLTKVKIKILLHFQLHLHLVSGSDANPHPKKNKIVIEE